MMADFVVPRHSAVMERLRRRIELFRRHHNNCESRYDGTAMERLELERQQTYALHQRCLQTKAKRSSKHRQPPAGSDQAAPRGSGTAGSAAELADSGTPGEQSRNSTLIALQEKVNRNLEGAGSPLGHDQVNGFSDGGYPPSKKPRLESLNGTSNGAVPPLSPLDTKHGIGGDPLVPTGAHGVQQSGDPNGVGLRDGSDQRLVKQEPVDDILPCMLPPAANNNLFPDLNEQEWRELMDELNLYEDYEEIFIGFEDGKDPELPAPRPAPGLLPPELVNIKSEMSPVPGVFEQDSQGAPSGPPMHTNSPATAATAPSPALPAGQPAAQPPRQIQPASLLPPKDLSPAQQLQQLAAREQQRSQMQQQTAKFHPAPNHPSSWQTGPSQSPLGGGSFPVEKSTSPSMFQQDFAKNLLMPGQQPNKGSPKAGTTGGYMQPGGHPNMHGHPPGNALSHPPTGAPAAMLDYNNTKPLSHYEAGAPGPPRGPAGAGQNKAALLNLIRTQQAMKQKAGMAFRPTHMQHAQDQGPFPTAPHGPGPGNAMASQPGASGMGGNHGNPAYLSGQVAQAAVLKQQQQQMQLMGQPKQFLLDQRQQQHMMAEQENQRQQQEQQMKRHLTRPPPQYQDQSNQPANQNPFQQQSQVPQFPGTAQPMGNVNPLSGPTPGGQRMFTQAQSMMGMGVGQGGGPAPGGPPAASQADLSLACGGGLDVQQVLYGNMAMHPSHPGQRQQQPVGAIPAAYRQNILAQQHLKNQANPVLLKQQMARLPSNMNTAMANSMPGTMAMPTQTQAWQQQPQQGMGSQPSASNGGMTAGFGNPNFHMQQRLPKMPNSAPYAQPPMGGRAMGGMNPAQMMPAMAQQRPNNPTLVQPQQQTQQPAPQAQSVLPDLTAFGQPQAGQVPNRAAGMQCNQGYQVTRTANQQLPFGYGTQAGAGLPSFPGESDLVDSLLKGPSSQEWMDDLDELLARHQ
ncbi:mastermind-like protein 1 [Denticeps clupeoides]|uniref:Neurogenic mastermind-like N-terminal domain-containing protein n=1 Tax=Denticeps clupeoides TaxID=299321 RepID=A0AAY4BLQ8_9TELE|nr:mastermind-like protein 1 [Denticeps clupeoides]